VESTGKGQEQIKMAPAGIGHFFFTQGHSNGQGGQVQQQQQQQQQ
jgi:hypothetical protein